MRRKHLVGLECMARDGHVRSNPEASKARPFETSMSHSLPPRLVQIYAQNAAQASVSAAAEVGEFLANEML